MDTFFLGDGLCCEQDAHTSCISLNRFTQQKSVANFTSKGPRVFLDLSLSCCVSVFVCMGRRTGVLTNSIPFFFFLFFLASRKEGDQETRRLFSGCVSLTQHSSRRSEAVEGEKTKKKADECDLCARRLPFCVLGPFMPLICKQKERERKRERAISSHSVLLQ